VLTQAAMALNFLLGWHAVLTISFDRRGDYNRSTLTLRTGPSTSSFRL
jgi:hypothetical protein